MIKYIVYPGSMMSKNDNQIHHISAHQLICLYGVKREECIIASSTDRIQKMDSSHLTPLYPRYDGNYKLDKEGV